ncbi:adenylate kinase [Basidiobolus meristosporus CBS 931.73]|uniref:GTP:AMP phosphotransferase, mitochondrial n=1 Tax=Basidiobolus meristosporus CBS 931.73 TaxID=1314790 RepID=A0A1Y1XZ44_9FUNG|nr:adenylate kinase [Basidiobolus meristosporus CBS 931.73]|eukprot:ORX90992.1 adenylate kinase [Basidiobolus meristosporus CBS 931.73]
MLLIGAPGAGKGTQASRIQNQFNILPISSGDLLRKNIVQGTEVGRVAQTVMASGGLVSDDIMVDLIENELNELHIHAPAQNWLLDGFPRSVSQAQALDSMLQKKNRRLNLVINLHVPEEVILQRIIDRWVHIPSGRVYNLSYNPPQRAGYDDITGEKLTKRPDDNPEIFQSRLKKYREATEPLLDYYDSQGVLATMSGRTSDEIYPKISQELNKWIQQ